MPQPDLRILYENDHLIAVDKDRGMAVHGGKNLAEETTLLYLIKKYLKAQPADFITPAHRLDTNTRGPVVFAKDRETAVLLNRAFKSGEVLKTYSALLEGKLSGTLFIEADLVKSSHQKALVRNMKILSDNIPKKEEWLLKKDPASRTISGTLILPLNHFDKTTLCSIETWTGRYHQIRAVCESIGHPVCGDKKYNHDPSFHYNRRTSAEYPDGQMLLCKTLEIPSLGILLTSGFELIPAI